MLATVGCCGPRWWPLLQGAADVGGEALTGMVREPTQTHSEGSLLRWVAARQGYCPRCRGGWRLVRGTVRGADVGAVALMWVQLRLTWVRGVRAHEDVGVDV